MKKFFGGLWACRLITSWLIVERWLCAPVFKVFSAPPSGFTVAFHNALWHCRPVFGFGVDCATKRTFCVEFTESPVCLFYISVAQTCSLHMLMAAFLLDVIMKSDPHTVLMALTRSAPCFHARSWLHDSDVTRTSLRCGGRVSSARANSCTPSYTSAVSVWSIDHYTVSQKNKTPNYCP